MAFGCPKPRCVARSLLWSVTYAAILSLALAVVWWIWAPRPSDAGPGVIAPKVLTLAMFQTGDPLSGGSGEATPWVQNDRLDQVVPVPGGASPLYCNATFDHCLAITGVLASNATASVMALGLNNRLDLTRTYIMVAGIGGGPPEEITIGAAAWADWVVSGDLVTEVDSREMPSTWQYPKAYLGCAQPWCPDGFRAGNEVFPLDPTMTAWAYRLSKDVALLDSPAAQAQRERFPQSTARRAPFVTTCALLGVNDFIHGRLMSDWGTWWVSQWTGGRSRFCISADEEGGIFTALQRLAAAGRVDMRRVSVLRVATDFMAAPPGESEADALAASLDDTFDFVGLENIYRVGSAVVREILGNWETWRSGPPLLPP